MVLLQDCGVMYYLSPAAGTGWHTYKQLWIQLESLGSRIAILNLESLDVSDKRK